MAVQDWSVVIDDDRNVIQIWSDGRRENLGPRDEVFTRWADLMGEDFSEKEFVVPEDGGTAG